MFLFGGLISVVLLFSGWMADATPAPIPDARSRPVALGFGMHVTPNAKENPIDPPERFEGYHAGIDYEVLASELDKEVPISAICGGSVLYSGYAEGYGGVLSQRCEIAHESVTVIYGHLAPEGLAPEGAVLTAGERLGILAPAKSFWSGDNRKHLHLGIHRGEEPSILGYVREPMELEAFIDPAAVLPRGARGRKVSQYRVAVSPQ